MTDKTRRQMIARIIFGTNTRTARFYDISLIVLIVLSVAVAMVDSVNAIRTIYQSQLFTLEWCLTILFTLDYLTRLICAPQPLKYARSFFGIIDLLSVIPTYLTLWFPESQYQYLTVIRFLRVLRLFRILKLSTYQVELQSLGQALKASSRRIMAFIFFVLIVVVVLGSLMYTIENNTEGFDSIPHSIYWAIVTLTTVGYGDISPATGLGRFIAALIMILGYSIIVIPTGIVAAAVPPRLRENRKRVCDNCQHNAHDTDAVYCKYCGHQL